MPDTVYNYNLNSFYTSSLTALKERKKKDTFSTDSNFPFMKKNEQG